MALSVAQPTDGELTILGAYVIGTLDDDGNFVQYTGGGGSQTPWLSDIDAADHALSNLSVLSTQLNTLDDGSGNAIFAGSITLGPSNTCILTGDAIGGGFLQYQSQATGGANGDSIFIINSQDGACQTYFGANQTTGYFGLVGTLSDHPLVFRSNNNNQILLDTSGNFGQYSTVDSFGNWQINSDGSFSFSGGLITGDNSGDITIGGSITQSVIELIGSANYGIFQEFGDIQFGTLGGGVPASISCSNGQISFDGGYILSDGSGNLTVNSITGVVNGATPVADGTYTPVTSITTVSGIITAIS